MLREDGCNIAEIAMTHSQLLHALCNCTAAPAAVLGGL